MHPSFPCINPRATNRAFARAPYMYKLNYQLPTCVHPFGHDDIRPSMVDPLCVLERARQSKLNELLLLRLLPDTRLCSYAYDSCAGRYRRNSMATVPGRRCEIPRVVFLDGDDGPPTPTHPASPAPSSRQESPHTPVEPATTVRRQHRRIACPPTVPLTPPPAGPAC